MKGGCYPGLASGFHAALASVDSRGPARFATACHGLFRSERGFPALLPTITYEPARGRLDTTSSAGAFSTIAFFPVLESGNSSMPRSKSTCSHLRVRITPSRAPVRINGRIAAATCGSIMVRRLAAFVENLRPRLQALRHAFEHIFVL
jgi:hypothetical protein